MTAVILLITLGGWLVYSALKGQSLAESLTGEGGDKLDPKGAKPNTSGDADIIDSLPGDLPPLSSGPTQFKGPNAARLQALLEVAQSRFHLSVSQICRPANANYGAPHSLHKECRAMDLTGTVANKVAFARYAKGLSWVAEVFCDQAGMKAPGYDHSDHVHVGA